MPNTAHGFPYPVLNDDNNPPADFQALAEAIDTEMFKTSTDAASLPGSGDFIGQQIRLNDTGEVAYWDGVEWQGYVKEFTPTWDGITFGTGTNVNRGLLLVRGRLVRIEFEVQLGTGGTVTSLPLMTLPYNSDQAANANIRRSLGQATLCDNSASSLRRLVSILGHITNDRVFMMYEQSNVGTSVTSTSPWTWAVNDSMTGSFSYFRVNPS